tara:strand:- start:182 stop:355 length:174 start_codon:yes stop_codon:yes gene_type:complete
MITKAFQKETIRFHKPLKIGTIIFSKNILKPSQIIMRSLVNFKRTHTVASQITFDTA